MRFAEYCTNLGIFQHRQKCSPCVCILRLVYVHVPLGAVLSCPAISTHVWAARAIHGKAEDAGTVGTSQDSAWHFQAQVARTMLWYCAVGLRLELTQPKTTGSIKICW